MKYDIKAIETKLMGYTFRSRLEARWAAFFELLGWRWDYEPVTFEGWMPDFALYGKKGVTYVEVKPILLCDRSVADKIDGSSCSDEVLIVGQTCPIPDDQFGPAIGWLREACCEPDEDDNWQIASWWWENAPFGRFGNNLGFFHGAGCWRDRLSEVHLGEWPSFRDDDLATIRYLWGEANSASRWVPRR